MTSASSGCGENAASGIRDSYCRSANLDYAYICNQEAKVARLELEELLTERRIELADETAVRSYVTDLREVLSNSPLPEQKAFIGSFVKEASVTGKEVLLTYTIPLPPEGTLQETAAVLDTVHYGGPKWTISRTFGLAFSLSA